MIRKLFSQAGQDLWVIRDVFNYLRGGYFVDIGAADGVELSNTCALERYWGWSGLCVEANPESYARLVRQRSCCCENVCIDSKIGNVPFDVAGGLSGGIVETSTGREAILPTTTFAELVKKAAIPETIHYLSLDVEGAEERVMATFPFDTHRFLCATIERPSENLRRTLEAHGYLLVAELCNLDAFYLHPDLVLSYNTRARIAAAHRARPFTHRLAATVAWIARNGVRAGLSRL